MMQPLLVVFNALVVAAAASADFSGPIGCSTITPLSLRSRILTPVIVGVRSATTSRHRTAPSIKFSTNYDDAAADDSIAIVRGGSSSAVSDTRAPCNRVLKLAYTAAGAATTAAWYTMCHTTIRSNQPLGVMMPSPQHAVFARLGAMSAAGLIAGAFASLAHSASKADSWEELGQDTSFRRHNLAIATTGLASSLWVRYAEMITRIPGTTPLASHQSYNAIMQARLIGCYGSAAALGAAVWARSLPEDVRRNPLSWPKRISDGVCKSLVSLAPNNRESRVQVKYSLMTSTFLIFTAMQTVCNMPVSVIPSWTSRRLSRAFPIYTFLGAVTAFDLKEATESGRLMVDEKFRYLSNGVKSFGGLYLGARAGAVLFDPSFPEHFGMVTQVPGLAVAAIVMVGLMLRSDNE